MSDVSEKAKSCSISVERISRLRQSIDRHNKIVASLLLFSKELIERRTQIESAFRLCKKAFVEVATALMELLEDSSGLRRGRRS